MNFISEILPVPEERPGYSFFFYEDRLLVKTEENCASIPNEIDTEKLELGIFGRQYLGRLNGIPCYCAGIDREPKLPEGWGLLGLRQLYGLLDEDFFRLAGRAVQIVNWDRTNQYCGRCGSPTETSAAERAKVCGKCGLVSYPRISPAIIVAVIKDKQILLARGRRIPQKIYSVLAGFVEPGETFEECLRREVREEVGLEVKNISYFGSQPWPFPNSLMVAFTAEYASGEITIDETEIIEAGWFTADNLPPIPGRISIARRLIDWFVEHVK